MFWRSLDRSASAVRAARWCAFSSFLCSHPHPAQFLRIARWVTGGSSNAKKKPPPKAGVSKRISGVLPCFHPVKRFSSPLHHAKPGCIAVPKMDTLRVGLHQSTQASTASPQAGDANCFHPWVCNDAQSWSASAFRRWRRSFSKGGPSGICRPLSMKTFGSLIHPFWSRWNRQIQRSSLSISQPSPMPSPAVHLY